MTDDDRELLRELKLLVDALGPFALQIMDNSATRDEQIALGTRLVDLAERIRDRAIKTPITIEAESPVEPDPGVALPNTTIEPHDPWPDLDWRP